MMDPDQRLDIPTDPSCIDSNGHTKLTQFYNETHHSQGAQSSFSLIYHSLDGTHYSDASQVHPHGSNL